MGPTACRVLLVEDDPDVRHVLSGLLHRNGYEVATAGDGRQALEYLSRHEPPRLILLDLVMPEMDGWTFLHARRQRPELLDVPVVVFSAVADCDGPDPRELGAAEVLRKPVGLAEVLDALRRYCAGEATPDFFLTGGGRLR
jgi:CheY-like chemotaxis protein